MFEPDWATRAAFAVGLLMVAAASSAVIMLAWTHYRVITEGPSPALPAVIPICDNKHKGWIWSECGAQWACDGTEWRLLADKGVN